MPALLTAIFSDSGGHPAPASVGWRHVVAGRTEGPLANGQPQMQGGGLYPPADCADSGIRTIYYNLRGRYLNVRDIETLVGTGPSGSSSTGIKNACVALGLNFIEHWGVPPSFYVWNPAYAEGHLDISQCGPYLVYNQDWWLEFTDPIIVQTGNPTPLPPTVPLAQDTGEPMQIIQLVRPPEFSASVGSGLDYFTLMPNGEVIHTYVDGTGAIKSVDRIPGRYAAIIDPRDETGTARYPWWWMEGVNPVIRLYATAYYQGSGGDAWQFFWRPGRGWGYTKILNAL